MLKEIKSNYRWTAIGGTIGILFSGLFKVIDYWPLSSLSGFLQIVSCALLSYLFLSLKEEKLKNHKVQKQIKRIMLILIVVSLLILCFIENGAIRWMTETLFGIAISVFISATDINH